MYEFFMFLLVGLGYATTGTVLFWAVRLGQFVWRGRLIRKQNARIKRLEAYYDESNKLMTKMVMSTWLSSSGLENQVMDLYQNDPRKGDQ